MVTRAMLISEIYQSKQGEGLLTGQESVFLRTSGCNLRCNFCDTPYTSWAPEGETWAINKVLEKVSTYAANHVVITGGEPMLVGQLPGLTAAIKALGKHITIETAGTIFKEVECDLVSISPKLSNSTPTRERAGGWSDRHEIRRLNVEVVRQLMARHKYQLKFVVCRPEDLIEIQEFCAQLGEFQTEKVMLMPEGTNQDILNQRENWVRELCQQHGYTFCPRMHIAWYGNQRGT